MPLPVPPLVPHGGILPAVCTHVFNAEIPGQYEFHFLPAGHVWFTVCADRPDRYRKGQTYPLTLGAPDTIPLAVEDVRFLHGCMETLAQRWREAIAEADTGATRPPQPAAARPGVIDIEPTPAGYRAAVRLFQEALSRVQRLHAVLGEHLDMAAQRDLP